MSLRNRITFTLAIIFAIALLTSIAAVLISRNQEKIIAQHNLAQHKSTCEAVLDLQNSKVNQVTFDYTYWDDFINFIEKPNRKWGEENISNIITSFNTDGV